ncbi:MAG: 50S ribosomal protein L25 [Deltaproteobacteria bacterium]|jgi:large subunit ribosomal protein L25|nr:50S ribosomal protein L25 [Deltaproteobacteria bacterium]MBT4525118.1 50S ribosomal protein L25 [Deltaproteobacteria bacterium]
MNLTVQTRESTGKESNKKLRVQGIAPGIIYGKESQLVSMNAEKAHRFIKSMQGAKQLFELTVEAEGKSSNKTVVIQDFQTSIIGNRLIHVDFLEVNENTRLTAEIPITVTDNCIAVKEGAVLQIIRRTVPVTCLASKIPETILVDVENLEFGSSIHVLDLDYPEGVKPIVKDRNFTVITVAGQMAEEVDEVDEVDAELEGAEVVEGEEAAADDKKADEE